jgi:hypothetical protein
VDGVLTDFGRPQTFEVVPMTSGTLTGMAPAEVTVFLRRLDELQRAVTGARAALEEALSRVGSIEEALMRSTVGNSSLDDEARALHKRLLAQKEALLGDQQKRKVGEPRPPSVLRRIEVVLTGNRHSTYGPTPTHRRSYEIAMEEFSEVREALHSLIDVELPALEEKLEAAGVPWTPGRGVPRVRGSQ